MSPDPIPVGVVGAGNMGANHVRVFEELPGVELVEVVEPDPEKANYIQDQYDVRLLEDIGEIEGAKAVTVAVPNRLHREVTVACIEEGLDVLVEKPLAVTVEDAQAIVDSAEDHDAILQVGHIERFNPAVELLEEILENKEIIAIEAQRLGPFNEHLSDENVVMDLMIHDLDVLAALVPCDITQIDAIGVKSRSQDVDHVVATLGYGCNVVGTLTASHVTHGKIRSLKATTRDAFIQLDYQEQTLAIQRRGEERTMTLDNRSGYRTETVVETPFVQTREPLKNELEHFLDCIRNRVTPRISGSDGIRAISQCDAVLRSLNEKC